MHPDEMASGKSVESYFISEGKVVKEKEVEDNSEDQFVVVDDEVDLKLNNVNGSGNGLNGHEKIQMITSDGNGLVDKINFSLEDEVLIGTDYGNGDFVAAVKSSAGRSRGPRRLSTSSRSSSASLSNSKPPALQMEVSLDGEDMLDDQMEPLIVKGSAEDLEVSACAPLIQKETSVEKDQAEFDEEFNDQHGKSGKASSKLVKPPKRAKTPPKVKQYLSKPPKSVKKGADVEIHTENLQDFEEKSPIKSPQKRGKILTEDVETADAQNKTEPDNSTFVRRSSRPRQTPQKYDSADYTLESSFASDGDTLNKTDTGFASAVRSVRGRRGLKKTRNMSALNDSLHNESSPWEKENFKILTPSGGSLSPRAVEETPSSSSKRKAESDVDDDFEREDTKKMCLESNNESLTSYASSFFSVVTSPFTLLRGKLRRSSVASSTPLKDESIVEEMNVSDAADKTAADVQAPTSTQEEEEEVEKSNNTDPQARKWCEIM